MTEYHVAYQHWGNPHVFWVMWNVAFIVFEAGCAGYGLALRDWWMFGMTAFWTCALIVMTVLQLRGLEGYLITFKVPFDKEETGEQADQ